MLAELQLQDDNNRSFACIPDPLMQKCNKSRGRPIGVFLWPMPMFRNQGGRYMMPIFWGRNVWLNFFLCFFFLYLIKSKSSNKK